MAEENQELAIDGIFVAIGRKPQTQFLKDQIEVDGQGYIKTKTDSTATNIDGVFSAGDVADPYYRQAIVAAGTGCQAALEVEQWLANQNLK